MERILGFGIKKEKGTQGQPTAADNERELNKPPKRYAVDVQRHTVFFIAPRNLLVALPTAPNPDSNPRASKARSGSRSGRGLQEGLLAKVLGGLGVNWVTLVVLPTRSSAFLFFGIATIFCQHSKG